jgi:WD40 repeat protein
VTEVDRIGRLYDVTGPDMRLLQTFRDGGTLSIAPDKKRVMAQYFTIRLYDPKTYVENPAVAGELQFAEDGRVLDKAAGARVRSGNRVYEMDPAAGTKREMDWLPGRPVCIPESGQSWGMVERSGGTLEILDFDRRQSIAVLPKPASPPLVLGQFPDGRRAVLIYQDSSVEVWNLAEKRILKHLILPDKPWVVAVSPDGRYLAFGFFSSALTVFDTVTWAGRSFPRVGPNISNLSFSPGGSRLVAGSYADMAEVWEVQSGRLAGKLLGHSQVVEDAAYSPDGRRIVTASDDSTIRIWDAATLRELTSLSGHKRRAVERARFTDDGSAIVSIDDLGNTVKWLSK